MSRWKSQKQLTDEIIKERTKLETLLADIPVDRKLEEVTDGMSVKDFLAHRTEWGKMVLSWYKDVSHGKTPAVPHKDYKWNQLKELNAEIYEKYKDTSLKTIERNFKKTHDELYTLAKTVPESFLLQPFINSTDFASYINSASAAHYRSAYKYINKWWKEQSK